MRASSVFASLFSFLLPPAIICTLILYLYAPLFQCSFPVAKPPVVGCMIPGKEVKGEDAVIAPFRLLALADPQLEGDSSLPDPDAPLFPSFGRLWTNVRNEGIWSIPFELGAAGRDILLEDLYNILQGYRKRLDLFGNDLYLAHIYRSVAWWSDPTHITVLGDVLGSQHISDDEFQRRSWRFWKRVFKGASRVPLSLTDTTGRSEVLGADLSWRRKLIIPPGNHDIGYAGDISKKRAARFEETFGSVNWDIRFTLENETIEAPKQTGFFAPQFHDGPPELHLVVLNSMNLDSPAKDTDLQDQSRDFATQALYSTVSAHSHTSTTVLLTHIPLYKEKGICADGPHFDWMPEWEGGGIKEQNHLSPETSSHLLNGLAKSGSAIVLNGHDHEGCDTLHYLARDDEASAWMAKPHLFAEPERADEQVQTIRELTVRSMMGEFGGNALFLSGWFEEESQEWKFDMQTCGLGVQHIWWGVHALDLFVLSMGVAAIATAIWEAREEDAEFQRQEALKKKSE